MHQSLQNRRDMFRDSLANLATGCNANAGDSRTSMSVNSVSLFLSRKPSTEYVTSPAKCMIENLSICFSFDLPAEQKNDDTLTTTTPQHRHSAITNEPKYGLVANCRTIWSRNCWSFDSHDEKFMSSSFGRMPAHRHRT